MNKFQKEILTLEVCEYVRVLLKFKSDIFPSVVA